MSDFEARTWYLQQEGKISGFLDKGASLESQARWAFDYRNSIRTFARELMANKEEAAKLYIEQPNWTWEQIVAKYKTLGLSEEETYRKIIESSQRSRASVNEHLGIPKQGTKPDVAPATSGN